MLCTWLILLWYWIGTVKWWLQNIPVYLIILWPTLFFKKKNPNKPNNKAQGRFLLSFPSLFPKCIWHSNIKCKKQLPHVDCYKTSWQCHRMCYSHSLCLSSLLLLKTIEILDWLAFHWETVMWGCEITAGDRAGDSQGYAFYCIRCWTCAIVWWHMIPWEFFLNSN